MAQRRSTIDFRKVIDQGKILLVKMAKGTLSQLGIRMFGTTVVIRLLMAASLGRRFLNRSGAASFFPWTSPRTLQKPIDGRSGKPRVRARRQKRKEPEKTRNGDHALIRDEGDSPVVVAVADGLAPAPATSVRQRSPATRR